MAIQPYPYVILSLQVLLASYPFDVSCVSAVLCPVHRQQNAVLLCHRLQAVHHIPCQLQHIHLFPLQRHFVFVQLRKTDDVSDQRNQPLGFVVDLSGKVGNGCNKICRKDVDRRL